MKLSGKARKTQADIRRLIAAGIPLVTLIAAIPATGAEVLDQNRPKGAPLLRQMPVVGLIAAPPEPPKADRRYFYVVKSGDTLSVIAKKHHTTVKVLCKLNNLTEDTKNHLSVGQKIALPPPRNRVNESKNLHVKGKIRLKKDSDQ